PRRRMEARMARYALLLFTCLSLAVPRFCLAQTAQETLIPAAVSPERKAAIETMMYSRRTYEEGGRRMSETFIRNASQDERYRSRNTRAFMDDVWRLLTDVKARERVRLGRLTESLDQAYAAGRVTAWERRSRQDAVIKLFQVHMMGLYGSILPRILDEAVVEDGVNIGRRFAGPEWKEHLTWDEMRALGREYKALSGFSDDEIDPPKESDS
ncbi:MAG: hypothetical protein ABIJ56_10600, partial [Pseudomonadota bacterium]